METRQILVRVAIILAFWSISGYSTTDILRLLKGNSHDVNVKDCFCPICNSKIRVIDQIPVLSYMICKGKCRNCGSKIPIIHFVLESLVFGLLSAISIGFGFQIYAFWCVVFVYEFIKCVYILKYGIREEKFLKNLIQSVVDNIVVFGLLFILFAFAQI